MNTQTNTPSEAATPPDTSSNLPSLNGVTLHVSDVERSLDFYQRVPGAQLLVHRPGAFALLQIGSGRLGLLKWPKPTFHLEFDSADLDSMYAALREAGLEPQSPPQTRPWGERDFLLLDPDGNMIEFGLSHDARDQS